ncbi:cupin domain-containing protein [Urechidicola croceus]|uniref:Cupin n=1 Tax=Urechidicola croceus TaxID=1850246 RepID=A0A1D8P516_9FLAO|nr:cupin domain-containing protein [Urechidicola croceus]AOW19657.1 cupin [Urechidicola croceus]
MNLKRIGGSLLLVMMMISCKNQNGKILENQQSLVFQKGEIIENNNFTGNAFLEMLVYADNINRNSVGNVTFEPGARTNWHSHPNGQIILVIDGKGYYQEKGSLKRTLKKGDVVKCPPNTQHWHGASADSEFVQIAITSRVDGPTQWLKAVSDEEYKLE